MKRYTADEIRDLYYTLPDDAAFYSRADLIAAGVLVPVPDGEAVGLDAIFNSKLDFRMNYMMDGEPVYNDGISMKSLKCHEFLGIDDDAEFQPVRLVKLEDVE